MGAKISLAALRDDPSFTTPTTITVNNQAQEGDQFEKSPPRTELRKSVTAPGDANERIYTDYVRKETRLRRDQIEALAPLARRLNIRRSPTNRRITENTLIRIAVDILLDRQDDLNGQTEAELRRSIATASG